MTHCLLAGARAVRSRPCRCSLPASTRSIHDFSRDPKRPSLNRSASPNDQCSSSGRPRQPCRRPLSTVTDDVSTRMQQHFREVQNIATSVRGFYDRGESFRIFHGSTNSTRKSAMGRDPRKVVDTSRLDRVLHVDVERRTALIQPNVPMDRLVEATLKHGLIPPVVMEFPGITAGGGFSGTSGESSSFKHGFFNKTLNKVEMVLATGDIVTCSAIENPDLFHGAPGALGTFGVTTLLEIQLHKATKYVRTTYHPVKSISEAVAKTASLSHPTSPQDYVDGILYSRTQGAIITGQMTDDAPTPSSPLQHFSHPRDPWFYMHVQNHITRQPSTPTSETIPLPEYLFRYDRGGFWVGLQAFKYFNFPFNALTRWWLDDFLHTRMLYKALHGSGQADEMIVQDLALPYATAEAFMEFTAEKTRIWPLWLCPLRQSPLPTMHPHLDEYVGGNLREKEPKPMLNIGLWGKGPSARGEFVQMNREIEAQLKKLKGMRWLYAQTYHSEDEFWEDFDREWYEGLRSKYHAQTLPNVYEKVRVDPAASVRQKPWTDRVWPLAGIKGLWKAIQSKDYVAARKSEWKDWVPRGRQS